MIIMASSWAPDLRYNLGPLYSILTNVMACRVFRGVALGSVEGSALNSTKIAAAFRSALPEFADELTARGTICDIT